MASEHDAASLESHLYVISEYSAGRGWTTVDYVPDLNTKGDTDLWDRPLVRPWLTDQVAEWDVMIWPSLDRISRDGEFMSKFLKWCRGNRKEVYVPGLDFNLADELVGTIMVAVLTALAQSEHAIAKARTASGRSAVLRKGAWFGGTPPFGYMPVYGGAEEGWRLTPDPVYAPVVQEVVARVIAGESVNSMANELTARGVPTNMDVIASRESRWQKHRKRAQPVGLAWSDTVLRAILKSRALLGELVYNGETVRDEGGSPCKRADPLVSEAEFERLQNALKAGPRRAKRSSPLNGVVKCGICGANMALSKTTHQLKTGKRTYSRYRCYDPRRSGIQCGMSIPLQTAQDVIERGLLAEIGEQPEYERVFDPGEDYADELAYMVQARKQLLDDRDAGVYALPGDSERFRGQILKLNNEIGRLSSLPTRPAGYVRRPTGVSYGERWRSLDQEGRRMMLLNLGVTLTVHLADLNLDLSQAISPAGGEASVDGV